ncbi:hypothetical protein KCP71_00745 [Salmonella enterica subsp. enterica]|nr:hypothetical protein KCP71_00745 [Salmonella enterica subsp. enterica]
MWWQTVKPERRHRRRCHGSGHLASDIPLIFRVLCSCKYYRLPARPFVLLMGLTAGFGLASACAVPIWISTTASTAQHLQTQSENGGSLSTFPTSRGHGFTITTAAVNMRLPTKRAARL